jgi:hypothetical protein
MTVLRSALAAVLVLWAVGLYMQGLAMDAKEKLRYVFHVAAIVLCASGLLIRGG